MRFIRLLVCLTVAILFLANCGRAPQPTATPAPARSLPTRAPTDTPAPTPTRPPLPPVVISTVPDRGQEQVLAAPIAITFDQPMDPANTSAAFSIEPKVPGEVQVKENRLIFSPTERLKRGAAYQVNVASSATSSAGLRLAQPVSFKFSTAGFLQVTGTQPTDKADGVPVDATLLVAFNRPIVSLTPPAQGGAGGGSVGASAPLSVTPTITGTGEWITTSIYQFTPAHGLAASTLYTITVAAGLGDTLGGLLADPFTATFRTADPTVLRWDFSRATPREKPENIKVETPITVTFSMAMDRAATEAAFKLVENENRVASAPMAGVFTWNAEGTTLSFKPARALKFGTHYYASVSKAAKPANGQGALRAAVGQEFTTVFPPTILNTTPQNNDTRASTDSGVRIEFASPLNPASLVSGAVTILPKPTRVFTNYSDWDNALFIDFEKLPDTAYTVTLSGKIADPYGNLLGRDFALRFTTRAYDPFVQLYSSNYLGTYNAYTSTLAALTYRNIPEIVLGLWRVPMAEFIPLAGRSYWEQWNNYRPSDANKLREWRLPADAPRNVIGIATTELKISASEPLPPGIFYLAAARSETPLVGNDTSAQRQLVIRTTLNVTLKAATNGALAWVTDLKSGQPVANAAIHFTDGAALDQQVTSDKDGVAEITFDAPREPWETLLALAATDAGGFGVASSAWTNGIAAWDFRATSAGVLEPYNGYLYTDRPIYRPGQTVYWKAIIRRDNDAVYALPAAGQPVTVTIHDGMGKTLLSQGMTLDGMGAVNGKLALDSDAGLGYYNIAVQIPAPKPAEKREDTRINVNFQVAEYRKPEYEVSAQTDRAEYIQGEQIKTTVQANYFFGQPVKSARVRWVLLSSDYGFQPPAGPEVRKGGPYSFSDWDWYDPNRRMAYGGALAQGEGITDATGGYSFSVPADITKFSQSQRFTIDVTILDANGQTVSTQTTAIIHKGEFYIGVRPQSYVAITGEPNTVDVLTIDPQGHPVRGVEVTLVANRFKWYSVKEQAEDGRFYWISKAEKTPVYTETVTTQGDGTARFTWTPKEPGEYKIEAVGRDRAGHALRSATYAWASGKDYTPWRQENNDRIQLVADKPEYTVGETARLLVASPYQTPVKALLTVERGGIRSHQVIEITGNSELIPLPIRADYAPDVFVSLILMKGMDATSPAPSFKMGLAALKVSVADKQLQVILTPHQTFEVSETSKVSNTFRASQTSEVSETSKVSNTFRAGQTFEVSETSKVSGTLRVPPREKLTWEVQILDAAGQPVEAETSLALIDKAVLTLADDMAGTLMNRFYRERGLGVTTGATLVLNVDRLVAQLARDGKGGGGGGGDGGDLTVRRDFPDIAYWNATVKTGADGKARVEVTLPDNLTTWTMDARAITADTRVGQAQAEIITTQELLVRPALPRFFTEGDKADIAAIVHNNTAAEMTVAVKLAVTGLQTTAATTQNATIKAGDTAKISWPVTVLPAATQAQVQMSASRLGAAGQTPLQDAVEYTLPIQRYTTPEVVGSSGQVAADESRLELFRLPPDADPTRGELEVRLEPSLAAGMLGGLSYLEHYPYECTEQTVSRFLPNVVSYQALKKLGGAPSTALRTGPSTGSGGDLGAQLAQQIGVGLQRLYAGQDVDGGWGWWPKDASNPTISSYVVFGMAKARQAGFTVDANALGRGVRYLKGQLKAPTHLQGWELNQQAFMLYALAEAAAGEPNRAGALYEKREGLSLYAKAHLALAFGLMDSTASASRIQTLLADFTSRAVVSATATHWEEGWTDYRAMNSDTRTTAIILDVLARLDPKHSLAPNAVRWLMTARKADHWETTQESAWAIIALTDWMAATGELEGNYAWQVTLNNAALGQGKVQPATVGDVTTLRADITKLLVNQTNALLIERSSFASESKGQLYYTVHLRTYQPIEKLTALNRGVSVSREYRLAECGAPPAGDKPRTGAECPPITQAKVGDVINVRLNIIAPHALYYLIVEDPLPAGTEAIDTSLRTTSSTAKGPEIERVKPGQTGKDNGTGWEWRGWWTPTHTDLRDEKVALFATWLEPGSYEFSYQIRASLPGEFRTMPPTASQMYHPEVWGRGAGGVFTVKP